MLDESDLILPQDPDAPIWRYMDFVRFMSLLDNKELFFPRADRLNDLHEGAMPRRNIENRHIHLAETIDIAMQHSLKPLTRDELIEKVREFDRTGSQRMYLSCWYMSAIESFGMWQVYGGKEQAVAIRSTYSALRGQLPVEVRIGCVSYIDYEQDEFTPNSIFSTFSHKRGEFADEHELRGMHVTANGGDGVAFQVDLSALVQEVVLAPGAPNWFMNLVQSVLRKYVCNPTVRRSRLDAPARF